MHQIITPQDLRVYDFQNLWELKNPKFSQAPKDSHDAVLQFKLRHKGGAMGFLLNYLTPSRLYGFRKLLAWLLWLFIALLIFATVTDHRTGTGEMGQIYFTLFFVGLYLLLFMNAGNSRMQRWDKIYTKAVKTDLATHTKPAIIFDGQDMLMANERVFEWMGDRPIAAFVDDYQDQLKHKQHQEAQDKKTKEKEKADLKKEKDAEAAKQLKKDLTALRSLGGDSAKKSPNSESLASRAAKAARGNLDTDSLSSRAARSARGAPRRSSNTAASSGLNSIKIEGYTGTYWQSCATGLDNNANYIARRMQQIRKSNPGFTKFRAVDSKGRVVDIG